MSEKKLSVTEEQFLRTVEKWMFLAGQLDYVPLLSCGFCEAVTDAGIAGEDVGCEDCYCFEEKLCNLSGSVYNHWQDAMNLEEKVQAALEMLEGLYRIGVKLGFYKEEEV